MRGGAVQPLRRRRARARCARRRRPPSASSTAAATARRSVLGVVVRGGERDPGERPQVAVRPLAQQRRLAEPGGRHEDGERRCRRGSASRRRPSRDRRTPACVRAAGGGRLKLKGCRHRLSIPLRAVAGDKGVNRHTMQGCTAALGESCRPLRAYPQIRMMAAARPGVIVGCRYAKRPKGASWPSDRYSCSSSASTTRISGVRSSRSCERLRESDTVRVIDSLAVFKDADGRDRGPAPQQPHRRGGAGARPCGRRADRARRRGRRGPGARRRAGAEATADGVDLFSDEEELGRRCRTSRTTRQRRWC